MAWAVRETASVGAAVAPTIGPITLICGGLPVLILGGRTNGPSRILGDRAAGLILQIRSLRLGIVRRSGVSVKRLHPGSSTSSSICPPQAELDS